MEKTGVFGQRAPQLNSPITELWKLQEDAGSVTALRHMYGAFLPVSHALDVKGLVLPVHVRQQIKAGQLKQFDESWGDPKYHHVEQFAVSVEHVDVQAILEDKTPAVFVAAVVFHEMVDDGFSYYTAERGLLQPGSSVREPVAFAMSEKIAAMKKYGKIVDAWEDSDQFEVARFVRRRADAWEFDGKNAQASTLWAVLKSYFGDKEAARQEEIAKALKRPVAEMDDATFARLFQEKMAKGV